MSSEDILLYSKKKKRKKKTNFVTSGRNYINSPFLCNSTTLYVGNMSFYTTEEQIYELFGKCGEVKRVVMGLDKFKRTPCGFCFIE